jgi:cell wall-associated NlpC family hydrolase
MLDAMHVTTDLARRLRHRFPVLIAALVAIGSAIGVVLATTGGRPAETTGSRALVPSTRPTSSASPSAVVPLLGASADANRAVPAVSATPTPSTGSTSAPPKVEPLHGLREADLLVVAPFSLSPHVLHVVSGVSGVTGADPIEAAQITINGAPEAILGVNPSTFRGYAAGPVAASDQLWQDVADGGVAVSYTMGTLDKLALGHPVTVAGSQSERLQVVAFGTVGIGGVDAVVSDSVARSLGIPASNAIVISAPPASVTALATRIKAVLPSGAVVEPLVTAATSPSRAGVAAPDEGAYGGLSSAQLTMALRAAESRQGLPYVWGAAGPSAFDCSGLVQWSFAQAGVAMPRVAADQARTGPAVPVNQLEPGDLLFYHTDPTAPGYISHVAIYLGNGWMIQAPQPGLRVEVVPAEFGTQYAGAVRVSPRLASTAAGGLD